MHFPPKRASSTCPPEAVYLWPCLGVLLLRLTCIYSAPVVFASPSLLALPHLPSPSGAATVAAPSCAALCLQFHPNIYPDGTLCMDLIQDNWSPIYSVCSILIAIRSLLTDPNCASPANPEAAHLYQTDKKAYSRRVRRVAEKSVSG